MVLFIESPVKESRAYVSFTLHQRRWNHWKWKVYFLFKRLMATEDIKNKYETSCMMIAWLLIFLFLFQKVNNNNKRTSIYLFFFIFQLHLLLDAIASSFSDWTHVYEYIYIYPWHTILYQNSVSNISCNYINMNVKYKFA